MAREGDVTSVPHNGQWDEQNVADHEEHRTEGDSAAHQIDVANAECDKGSDAHSVRATTRREERDGHDSSVGRDWARLARPRGQFAARATLRREYSRPSEPRATRSARGSGTHSVSSTTKAYRC